MHLYGNRVIVVRVNGMESEAQGLEPERFGTPRGPRLKPWVTYTRGSKLKVFGYYPDVKCVAPETKRMV